MNRILGFAVGMIIFAIVIAIFAIGWLVVYQ